MMPPKFIEKTWGNGETVMVENPDYYYDENNPGQKKRKRNSNYTKPKRRSKK